LSDTHRWIEGLLFRVLNAQHLDQQPIESVESMAGEPSCRNELRSSSFSARQIEFKTMNWMRRSSSCVTAVQEFPEMIVSRTSRASSIAWITTRLGGWKQCYVHVASNRNAMRADADTPTHPFENNFATDVGTGNILSTWPADMPSRR